MQLFALKPAVFFTLSFWSNISSLESVDDEATKALMGEIFNRYGGATPLPPAKALREGMLALLEQATKEPEHHYFAHPYAWAAFSLVGESAVNEAP